VSLNNGINVRLAPETRSRLETLAERSGVKSSVLIRQAIMDYCTEVEATGKVSFRVADGPANTMDSSPGAIQKIEAKKISDSKYRGKFPKKKK